jgi:hypothetical protein
MPRPEQAALDALFEQLQDEFRRGPIVPGYPRPRARTRAEIAALPTEEGVAPPLLPPTGRVTGRIWPYFAAAAAGPVRTTVVSPAFNAPCMIDFITLILGAPTNPAGFALLWSTDDSGGQTDGTTTVIPSGTQVLDPRSFRQTAVTHPDELTGTFIFINDGVSAREVVPLKYIIDTTGRVFLKLSVRSSGTASSSRGVVVVREAPTVADLMLAA